MTCIVSCTYAETWDLTLQISDLPVCMCILTIAVFMFIAFIDKVLLSRVNIIVSDE